MGFEHERIHLETSSVLIRELPAHLVTRPAAFPAPHPSAYDGSAARLLDNPLVPVPAGAALLGKPRQHPSFGWDNEYGARRVEVPAFAASRFLVTNGEMLDFVRDGGYSARGWWTEAGWQWRAFRNVLFPTFWVPDGPVGLHRYRLRAVFDLFDLPLAWPALVNAHEARAYCAWRSARDGCRQPLRLLTEAEHHLLRDLPLRVGGGGGAVGADPAMLHGGADVAACRGTTDRYNLQLAWGSESPVDELPASSAGVHDSMGNVWNWTEDDFNPLEGFEISPLYTDFSTPCFDGLHSIIMGGSFASTGDEASIFSRFHFRPHFHQHAGFRLVTSPACPATTLPKQGTNAASITTASSSAGRPATAAAGESEAARDEFMLFHYGARKDVLPWDLGPCSSTGFPTRVARMLVEWCGKQGVASHRALDLGCSVGGSAFELATNFSEVLGLDSSWRFIEVAQDMKRAGQRIYKRKEEGDLHTQLVASVEAVVDRKRVEFAVEFF